MPNDEYVTLPSDITREELMFLELVKQKMLQKLPDRAKFLFVYCYELGHDQRDAAIVLDVHETAISQAMKEIRELLGEFRK